MGVAAAENIALKTAFERSGLTRAQLSAKSGLAESTIHTIFKGGVRNTNPLGCWKLEKTLGCAIWMKPEEFETRRAILKWIGFDPFTSPLESARRRLNLRGIKVPVNPVTRERMEAAVFAAYRARFTEAQAAAKLPPPVPAEIVGGVPLHHASCDTIYLLDRIKAEPGQEWTPEQARAVAFGLSVPDRALSACASEARDVFAEAAEYLSGFPNVNLSELTARCAALISPLYENTNKPTP